MAVYTEPRTEEVRAYITLKLRSQLEAIARENDRSLSGEIRRAVKLYAEMMGRKNGTAQDYRELDRG